MFCGETDFSDRFIKEEEEGTQGRRPWEEFRDDSDKRMAGKVHRVANFMVNYELIPCTQQFVQTRLMFRSSWPTRKASFLSLIANLTRPKKIYFAQLPVTSASVRWGARFPYGIQGRRGLIRCFDDLVSYRPLK